MSKKVLTKSEVYSKFSQTSKTELYAKIVNDYKQ